MFKINAWTILYKQKQLVIQINIGLAKLNVVEIEFIEREQAIYASLYTRTVCKFKPS